MAMSYKESLEWNPSLSKKSELTHQLGMGGEGGSGKGISHVQRISHWLQCPIHSDVSFPRQEALGERGGGELARGKKTSRAVSRKLARAQAVSSRCATRDDITWLILPSWGWCQDLTKLGNTYQETHLRHSNGAEGALRMQPRWGPYSRKYAQEAFLPPAELGRGTTKWAALREMHIWCPGGIKTYAPWSMLHFWHHFKLFCMCLFSISLLKKGEKKLFFGRERHIFLKSKTRRKELMS